MSNESTNEKKRFDNIVVRDKDQEMRGLLEKIKAHKMSLDEDANNSTIIRSLIRKEAKRIESL